MARPFPSSLKSQFPVFKKLSSFRKIQDFISGIPMNFEETVRSPLKVLEHKKAHCLEAAMLAAGVFWYHGEPPLILQLRIEQNKNIDDYNHVVTLFKYRGRWGAISKTNHATLRYRDPIYRDIHELAASFFHEYSAEDGTKILRDYSGPFDLSRRRSSWLTSEKNLVDVESDLFNARHYRLFPRGTERYLRPVDPIERSIDKITEWKRKQ